MRINDMSKRKILDFDKKVLILQNVDSDIKKKDVASKYGLAVTFLVNHTEKSRVDFGKLRIWRGLKKGKNVSIRQN